MEFTIQAVFCRSVTLELVSDTCFASPGPVRVFLNNAPVKTASENVISLFGLAPSTEYTVAVECGGKKTEQRFVTKAESILLDVKRFGAAGDGRADDTAKLQAAILACPEGGTVAVPAGTYRTASLFLKSEMTLWLQKDACLLGETDRNRYPVLPGMTPCGQTGEYNLGTWEGNPLDCYAALLTGIDVRNVDIIGEGVLDANAQNGDWWQDAKTRRGAWRPFMLYLLRCSGVRMQGVAFRNSYSWTIHPYYSQKIEMLNITITNHCHSPNTDGIDPESCADVKILGCVISVGDDCIAIKSGKRYMAEYHPCETRGVTVRNCRMERGHGSVVIGSEVSAGVYEVHVSQCVFAKTDRGLRIKTRRGRGESSVLDGIALEHIRMDGVLMPFTVNMFYFCDPDGHSPYVQSTAAMPVDDGTPTVGHIRLADIACTGATASGGFFYGLPEKPIECITMEHVSIEFAENAAPEVPIMMDHLPDTARLGLFAKNVKELNLSGLRIRNAKGGWPVTENVSRFSGKELAHE